AQTLGLTMAIGTMFGHVMHTIAATPGNRSWFADTAFMTAATVRSTFQMDAAATIALVPVLAVVGLALGAVAANTKQPA
ncbi:MAG: hypothetical protein QGF53_08915, partial [Alphaproteobacteria bacterium]|nr:hypothetical protein [Alphaproteobacteria bacterium]